MSERTIVAPTSCNSGENRPCTLPEQPLLVCQVVVRVGEKHFSYSSLLITCNIKASPSPSLPGCSIQESGPFSSPWQQSRTDPAGRDAGERGLGLWEWDSWPHHPHLSRDDEGEGKMPSPSSPYPGTFGGQRELDPSPYQLQQLGKCTLHLTWAA